MSNCQKLYEQAQQSTANIRFEDLCALAECFGWEFKRQKGSHQLYENKQLTLEQGRMMNFQSVNGKAKPYQVKQLLTAIKELPS
ncbi:MAG: type II toxin-antitoxin system HicA family toxin [Acidobacteria bacterium]|nr:type II toxin-antitoxin system HicA family toxin [Acidobacteriota bacterium]